MSILQKHEEKIWGGYVDEMKKAAREKPPSLLLGQITEQNPSIHRTI
jgi:hypothetical protein